MESLHVLHAAMGRAFLLPRLLELEANGSLYMHTIHRWLTQAQRKLVMAAAYPEKELQEAFVAGEQMGLSAQEVAEVVQPFATEMLDYFSRETRSWYTPSLALAMLGNPSAAQRATDARHVLVAATRSAATGAADAAAWTAHGILTDLLQDVWHLAATGELTPVLHQRLHNVYAHVPVTNAGCETDLKV